MLPVTFVNCTERGPTINRLRTFLLRYLVGFYLVNTTSKIKGTCVMYKAEMALSLSGVSFYLLSVYKQSFVVNFREQYVQHELFSKCTFPGTQMSQSTDQPLSTSQNLYLFRYFFNHTNICMYMKGECSMHIRHKQITVMFIEIYNYVLITTKSKALAFQRCFLFAFLFSNQPFNRCGGGSKYIMVHQLFTS